MKTYEIEFKLNDGSLIKLNANNAKNRQTITIATGIRAHPRGNRLSRRGEIEQNSKTACM